MQSEQKEQKESRKGKKQSVWLDKDVEKFLAEAEDRTGKNWSLLINETLRTSLPVVIKFEKDRQSKIADSVQQSLNPNSPQVVAEVANKAKQTVVNKLKGKANS